jgi:Protein of unknown function (DUF998)
MKYLKTIHLLSVSAIIGPIFFTLAWFILGFVSKGFTIYGVTISPYSPISAQISGLGLGSTAIYMNTTFILTGVLLLVGLVGIFWKIDGPKARTSWISALLLAITPLGAIMAGLFTINSGFIHYMVSMISFVAPIVSFVVTGLWLQRIPRWRIFGKWLIMGSPLTLILIILFFLTFIPTPQGQEVGIAGLVERVLTTEVLFWYAAMGWLAFRFKDGMPALKDNLG